ncbi:TPA: DNA helicase, partial [Salmonella enterica subsp. enterica]|nr:DNA helicase [Salmonella enterica subsp. enterica]
DFPDILDPDMPESQRQDEINLMYVAATRARKVLITDPILHELLIQPRAEDIAGTSADKSGESEVSTENDKKGTEYVPES